jgi:hypothetical protein
LVLHVRVPPVPQASVALGTQAPSFAQADQSDQTPLLHVRDLVPQLPHAWAASPAQDWLPQAPHWQVASQVRVPPIPQASLAFGTQAPWFAHVDQSDHTPLLHVRDWVPQLPQPWVAAPAQL